MHHIGMVKHAYDPSARIGDGKIKLLVGAPLNKTQSIENARELCFENEMLQGMGNYMERILPNRYDIFAW